MAFVKAREPELAVADLRFESRYLSGGRFAKSADGACCIVLTGDAPFRLCVPRSELIEIPSEAEEHEIVAGLPESDVLALLRSFGSPDFPGLVFSSCGLDEEKTGEFYLAPLPCVPAYPSPVFSANDVTWTLPLGASKQLRVLVGIDATKM